MDNITNFHIAAFYGSITNGVADVSLGAVADSILTQNGTTQFILPQDGRVRMAWAGSANLQRVKLNTPAMRFVGLPYFAPVNAGLTVPSPPNLYDPGDYGPLIPRADGISIQATQGGGAAENGYCIVAFVFRNRAAPAGPSYRIRFTSAIAGSIGAWANGTMTPDNTLPAGIYSVVGMDIQGTNLVAARLIFAGGGWRPGCIARNTLTSIAAPQFQKGALGEYGQFDSVNVPNLEIFVTGANAAQETYLDVVRVGPR